MADVTGLIPLSVDLREKTVTLADLDLSEFSEPFFGFTVRRITAEAPGSLVTVSWSDLIAQSETWTDCDAVAGLIFNVGRCGSTLLSNMVKAHPDLWVLSEPEPLDKPELISRRTTSLDDRTEAEAIYRANALLLQQRAISEGKRLLIKYPSWLAARAPTMAARHPEASVFGLYRDPFEVVASYIAKPAPFAAAMHLPTARQLSVTPAMAALGDGPMTGAAYYASIWVSTMVGAMAVADDRLLLLDYAQLKSDAEACIAPLMGHLGLEVSDEIHAAILAATRGYAKDRSPEAAAFEPSGAHERRALSPRTQAEVARVIDTMEQRLLAHPCHLELPA